MAMFVLATSGVVMASPAPWAPDGTLIYVDHWLSTAEVGETFTVSVKVQDVTDLFLADFEMTIDYGVLEIVDDPATDEIEGIEIDDQANSFDYLWNSMLWLEVTPARTWMKLKAVTGRPAGVKEGLSGTVGLAKLTFIVKGRASLGSVGGILKLFFTDLIDVDGNHVGHMVADGMFATDYPILWAKKKGAHGTGIWTDWSSTTYYDGLTNTLNAKIVNTGTQGAMVRMIFKIERPDAMTDEIASAPVFVPAGDTGTVSVSCALDAPGRYAVTGFVEYEIVPFRWISWAAVEPILGGLANTRDTGNTFRAR